MKISKALREVADTAAKRAAAAKQRERDVIDVREDEGPALAPTPEQMARTPYVEDEAWDRSGAVSVKLGKAFQRRYRFETIEGLTPGQLDALRYYRAAFDQAELSATKSALDIRPRGSGIEGAMVRMETIISAGMKLSRIEARMPGALLGTLRAVAGLDADFKTVAIERFGGRDVERIDTNHRRPRIRVTIEPRSGRHRAAIRDEFLSAAEKLEEAIRPLRAAQPDTVPAPAAPASPAPCIDPAFMDERGYMLPMSKIIDIILGRDGGDDADRPDSVSN